jgi:non-specific serine/threonine protein kinase
MALVFDPRAGRWSTIPRPTPREHLSAGGEEPGGTIASVYAYDPAVRRWTRLPNLRTPRHGLAVVGRDNRVYAVAGGPAPGLSVSGANEVLTLP